MRRHVGALALVALLSLVAASAAHATSPNLYGFQEVSASLSTHQAGAHPDFSNTLELKQDPATEANESGYKEPYATTRNLSFELPPGLLANPSAVPQCSAVQFQAEAALAEEGGCPPGSQVGVAELRLYELGGGKPAREPIFLLKPPGGNTVARLGVVAVFYPVYLDAHLRSASDFGATVSSEGTAGLIKLVRSDATVWGVPAATTHDFQRVSALQAFECMSANICSAGRSSGSDLAPFMSNPTSCGGQLQIGFSTDSYQLPGKNATAAASLGEITGCEALSFAPSLSATPTTHVAASPSGLDVDVKIPQNENANGFATSQLRDATVQFPPGMTLAAGAADGLQACSDGQARYGHDEPAECPGAAKVGSVEIDSPALPEVLQGALYQRSPGEGHLFRVWLIADGLGVHLKLPGELEADPQTGQLTSLFIDNPQAPVREIRLHIKAGARAPLATPRSCGTYLTHYTFVPWSGNATVSGGAPMTIDEGCGTGGFSPKLSAGSANPAAGAFSTFLTDLTLESGEQNLDSLDVTLPPGVLAKLAGVALCEGQATQSGDCPANSRVASAAVASGPGPAPLWLPQAGKEPIEAYLSGPYKGAPYGLVIKAPAQAGPFDLGTIVTRAAIYVNPETAQATVRSDALPQILQGVPISYRHIHVAVDRPEFTLNPTSCNPAAIKATVLSVEGATANPTSRFQVGGCASLPFKPRLSMRLRGKTNRGAHPRFQATLSARDGDANIARAQVTLPHSEFLEQEHIRTICTRVQFSAEQCPAGSVYGHARAITPLLDQPLEGPVYLRSSSHELPDLVVALRGQVDFNLVGRIDSVRGGIRSTFGAVPDAPVSKFTLTMQGGKKGLLVNSRDLCSGPSRSLVQLDGQNGKTADERPLLHNDCATGSRRHPTHHKSR